MSRLQVFLTWATLSVSIAYLGVPILSSLSVSVALVLHASLGALVLRRLLGTARLSTLMFCGPSLIIGGPLAFAVFQAAGRGGPGLVISIAVCILALFRVLGRDDSIDRVNDDATIIYHVLGLAALALSSQFSWLLVIALACFSGSLMVLWSKSATRLTLLLGLVVIFAACAVGVWQRDEFWWVVTDDYNLFETISRHVTAAGPLERWGEVSFMKYHWLSYGWAGLLDVLAVSPGPLVTVSKIMPFVYSVALASSLLVIPAKVSTGRNRWIFGYLPIWVVLANTRIDWSATSTAGIFAVLTALLATIAAMHDAQTRPRNRTFLYLLFGITVTLTKAPSVLTLPAIIMGFEGINLYKKVSVNRRILVGYSTTLTAGIISVALLQPFRSLVGGFELLRVVDLVRLSGTTVFLHTVLRSIAQNLWILVLAVVLLALARRMGKLEISSDMLLLLSLSSLFFVGAVMNSVIEGTEKANPHEYFSGPNYFLSSLPILAISALVSRQNGNYIRMDFPRVSSGFALSIGVAATLYVAVSIATVSTAPSIRTLISDVRIWTGVVFLFLYVAWRRNFESRSIFLVTVLILVFVTVGLWRGANAYWRDWQKSASMESELESIIGSSEIQQVGEWLREHTAVDEQIATNHLFLDGSKEEFGDDYSLAVWSQREFLILGPKFFDASQTASEAIDLSVRFAENPTVSDARQLLERGVSWFVVDKGLTSRQTWAPFGQTVFEVGQFSVLRLESVT